MTLTKSEKEQLRTLEDRLSAIERKLSRIQNIVIGIAVGIALGAIIFGFMSVKEFLSFVK